MQVDLTMKSKGCQNAYKVEKDVKKDERCEYRVLVPATVPHDVEDGSIQQMKYERGIPKK